VWGMLGSGSIKTKDWALVMSDSDAPHWCSDLSKVSSTQGRGAAQVASVQSREEKEKDRPLALGSRDMNLVRKGAHDGMWAYIDWQLSSRNGDDQGRSFGK